MKIHIRLLLYIVTSVLVVNVLVVGIISYQNNRNATREAYRLADLETEKYAQLVSSVFNQHIQRLEDLAILSSEYDDLSSLQRKNLHNHLMESVLRADDDMQAIALVWELSALDSTYLSPHGRVLSGFYRANDKNLRSVSLTMDVDAEDLSSPYYQLKSKRIGIFEPPAFYRYTPNSKAVLVSTMAVPIIKHGKFIGAAEMDISLASLSNITRFIRPFDRSYAFLVAHDGTIASHPSDTLVSKSITEVYANETLENDLLEKLKLGEPFSFVRREGGDEVYYSFAPVLPHGINKPWSVGIVVPRSVILQRSNL